MPASSSTPQLTGAHLVGSINLPDAAAVFTAASEHLGDHLVRIPDGEVGERFYWLQFQTFRFDETPGLERVGELGFKIRDTFDVRPFRLDGSVEATELVFPDLGYATSALDSYAAFVRLRDAGVIAPGVRFQVSLPTPAAVVGAFFVPEDRLAIEPVYEEALFGDLRRILAAIPHQDLAIQWDTAVEFALLEEGAPGLPGLVAWFPDTLGGILERAARQAAAVPDDVEVGFHLCYGDIEESHFVQPTDAGRLADFIGGVLAKQPRRIDFIHLPVPIERDDEAYFAPLAALDIPDETRLYLGLVHHEDGIEGARRRIAAAGSAVPRFGVATECGFGRGPAERTAPLFDLHAQILTDALIGAN